MKHLLLLCILSLCIPYAVLAKDNNKYKDENRVKNILSTRNKIKRHDRGMFSSVEAQYDSRMGTVELACYEMKETAVYIVDSKGKTVYQDIFDSTSTPFMIINAPVEPGRYWIFIDSEILYAEGQFTVE